MRRPFVALLILSADFYASCKCPDYFEVVSAFHFLSGSCGRALITELAAENVPVRIADSTQSPMLYTPNALSLILSLAYALAPSTSTVGSPGPYRTTLSDRGPRCRIDVSTARKSGATSDTTTTLPSRSTRCTIEGTRVAPTRRSIGPPSIAVVSPRLASQAPCPRFAASPRDVSHRLASCRRGGGEHYRADPF